MVGTELPFMKLYVRDWLTDPEISELTYREQGILLTLVCYFWLKGSLPSDTKKLARLLRLPVEEFEAVWQELRPLFESQDDGTLTIPYFAELRENALTKKRKAKEDGKKGARIRWNKEHDSRDGDGSGDPNRDPIASTDSRTRKSEDSLLRKNTSSARDDENTNHELRSCPDCYEVEIEPHQARCSRCNDLRDVGFREDGDGSAIDHSDLPF